MSENIKNPPTDDNDEISLKDLLLKIKEIFNYLLKKWYIILIIGLLGGAIGLTLSLLGKTKYNANLTFIIQEKGSSGGGLAALAGQFGVNLGGGSDGIFSGNNILELLKSHKLVEAALLSKVNINNKEQRLIEYYFDIYKINEKLEKAGKTVIGFPLSQNRADFSRAQDSVLNLYVAAIPAKNLTITKKSKDAGIALVGFKSENELFAKYFTEILVKGVIEYYTESRTGLLRANLTKMEANADSLKRDIDGLMLKMAVDADRNRDIISRARGVTQQRDQIQLQQLSVVYTELVKNVEVMKLDLVRETPLIQIIDTPIMPLEKQRLGKAKGIITGGIIAVFLAVAYLLCVMFFRNVMKEE